MKRLTAALLLACAVTFAAVPAPAGTMYPDAAPSPTPTPEPPAAMSTADEGEEAAPDPVLEALLEGLWLALTL